MPKGDPWKPMELKMPVDLYDLVDALASRQGQSRSEYIRQTLHRRVSRQVQMIELQDDPAELARLWRDVEAAARERQRRAG